METLLAISALDFLGKPAWVWLGFVGVVAALLAFDLGVLHRDEREIGVRESLLLSAGYIGAATLFGAWVWWYLGAQSGIDYFTGFMIEKSLSMDNVFVIALIFGFFAIPRALQHRVLFWGILGVIVLRALMIGLGAALVTVQHAEIESQQRGDDADEAEPDPGRFAQEVDSEEGKQGFHGGIRKDGAPVWRCGGFVQTSIHRT